jgi:hypothetical protein
MNLRQKKIYNNFSGVEIFKNNHSLDCDFFQKASYYRTLFQVFLIFKDVFFYLIDFTLIIIDYVYELANKLITL